MNAVIYARYSSDSQREESIEGQLRECREYAERNNMTIVGTYIDRALSAKTADRPEFQHMIKDSAKELFEIVLVWKLDRFFRDRYDSAHYKHVLKKNGVKVISAKEHISEGPEGIILEAMLEGYAEFYSAELSEKIHRGQKENALKGKNNGGGIPLGYLLDKKAQKLVVDPVTAPLVVEIFEKYADGKTVRSIVEDFNARGLRTKKGQPFNINSFSSLLKKRKYIGEYRYQDVVIEGGVPAIIPEDLFNRVQERMEKNRHAPAMAKAKEYYLLTTKLFCGKCERMMVGESGKSHTGAMHYYYKCGGAKRRKGCDKKAVRKDWIERVVVRLTMQRVMDEEKINRLIDTVLVMQEQEDTTTPALRSQLAETESAIGNILKAIEQGIFTPSTKQRLDELEARKEEILVNIQTAELQKPKLTREQMTAWFEQFRHGNPANREFQKCLIDTFVNAVYVFDDKLVLTYNYQHGTQTISLDEIESALSSDFDGATPPTTDRKANALRSCSVYGSYAPPPLPTTIKLSTHLASIFYTKMGAFLFYRQWRKTDMAQQEEMVLWIDRRRKNAIEKHLNGQTLQEHLENVLDELCNQLPEREYERISHEIQSEAAAQRAKEEAARTYAAYHVTERGQEWYFKTLPGEKLLEAGKKLRSYITKGNGVTPDKFIGMFFGGQPITAKEFDDLTALRMENTGKVRGVFDVNFDKREFSAVNIMDGWQTWAMHAL